jgi:hypothetical protein
MEESSSLDAKIIDCFERIRAWTFALVMLCSQKGVGP